MSRREANSRISPTGYSRKIQPSHVTHVGVLVRKLPHTGGESPVQSVGVARATVVSFAGARGRCLGCDWRGHRLLRNGARLCQIARTIWPPDCRLPTRAGKTRLDGAGDHEGTIAGPEPYWHDGSRDRASVTYLLGQVEKR